MATNNLNNDVNDDLNDDVVNGKEPATKHDVTEGGVLGAVGGAIVGGLAGGPVGAIIGAIAGGVVSAGAVDVVDKHDHDYNRTAAGTDHTYDTTATTASPSAYDTTAVETPIAYDTTARTAPATLDTTTAPTAYAADTASDTYTDTTPVTTSAYAADTTRTNIDGQEVIPVIDEELAVGKRQVQGGTARVHTAVVETPIEEQITLHDEKATIERHLVDRVATDADLSGLSDRTYEVTEIKEVPVVSKEARVVEEIVVGKTATDRTETIRDTVRHTAVEVDELDDEDVRTTTR